MGGEIPPFLIMALPIPDDWNNTDYVWLLARVPDSPMWRGMARGALYDLSMWYRWDQETGDQYEAAAIAATIFDSIQIRRSLDMELQFLVHLSGQQSVSAYDSVFQLNTAELNLNGQFDLVTYKWTVPQDGVYQVGAWVQFLDMTGTGNWVRVRTTLNGVMHLSSGNATYSDTIYPHAHLDLPCYLSQGDEVQFLISHSDLQNPSTRSTSQYNRTQRAWAYRLP